MAEVQWIKLYTDIIDHPKAKKIRRLPAGNDILLIWIMLLVMAGRSNANGIIYITEKMPYTEEDLAEELKFDVNTIRLATKAFEELDMLSFTEDGFHKIINWEEYQSVDRLSELREYNRIAKQRSREKQRMLKGVNDKSMTSQRCQGTEEEEDKEKEKEFHSIIPAPGGDDVENSVENSESQRRYLGGSLGRGLVMLSDEQIEALLDKLSVEEFDRYVGIVADCEEKGQHFKKKTHYQAILDMAKKDRRIK